MKNKLISIKAIIEGEIGERIDTKNRRRDLTYARAIYCKIGRDLGLSLSAIGQTINRDHATVLHSLNVILPFAEEQHYYLKMYKTLSAFIQQEKKNDDQVEKEEYIAIRELSSKVEELQKENSALRYKLQLAEKDSNPIAGLIKSLSEDELKEVYERVDVMVRSIKSRVYQ